MRLLAVAALTKPIRAQGPCGCTLTVGDGVTVDGLMGRGVIVARKGRRLVIRFRDGEYLSRDQRYVHKITSDYVSRYSSNRETNMVLNAYGTSEGVKKEWDTRGRTLYHVTHTKLVPKIQRDGLKPMQTSNWVKGDHQGDRYGSGEVYAFEHPEDAVRWAAKMDWQFNKQMGTGKVSILKLASGKQDWKEDSNDPLSQASSKGKWLKYMGHIPAEQVGRAVPLTPELTKALVQGKGVKLEAAEITVEQEGGPLKRPTDSYIVRQGALHCVKSHNQQDQNFGCFNSREEAEAHLAAMK